jgi:hypothetical protein
MLKALTHAEKDSTRQIVKSQLTFPLILSLKIRIVFARLKNSGYSLTVSMNRLSTFSANTPLNQSCSGVANPNFFGS